ncbi:hypothetical protein B0G66_1236 [Bacillus badius]|nr:hypothetical protein B0G66_1236 [Bacillus badius]
MLKAFEYYLTEDGKSENTVKSYMQSVSCFLGVVPAKLSPPAIRKCQDFLSLILPTHLPPSCFAGWG